MTEWLFAVVSTWYYLSKDRQTAPAGEAGEDGRGAISPEAGRFGYGLLLAGGSHTLIGMFL